MEGQFKINVNKKNKSNSTAGAVQVEANLQEQLNDHLHFRKLKCGLRARYLKSVHMFALALAVFETLKFQIVYLKISRSRSLGVRLIIGQGH